MDSQVAVKAVMQNDDGKFLIAREGSRWQGIGGRLEKGELKHIVAVFFLCRTHSDKVELSDEHQEYAWVTADELEDYGDTLEKEIKQAIILASA